MSEEALPIGLGEVREAAARLRGVALRTPLLRDTSLDALVGARLLIKVEPLQRTGSFKFRGAYNAIARSSAPAVVAWSSGNHAQGVALAAALLGKRATIVMPADASEEEIKQAALSSEGARRFLDGSSPRQIHYVKGRLVNIVV